MKLRELADKFEAELEGSGDLEIMGAAGVHEAQEGQVTFIVAKNHLKRLEQSRASAAFVPLDTPAMQVPLLRVKNPRLAFARALELFYVKPYRPSGISDQAAIGRNVVIGSDPSIHPFVVVADDAKLGDRVTLYSGVYIGQGSSVDDDSIVYQNVSIRENVRIGKRAIIHAGTVIGSDGFGFVTDNGIHHKIPQVGGVMIEDDVEIGSNCSIDRATLGNTLIKKGTKIDNQVHVAHNVVIGEHCLLAAQAGIAGSATLGNYVVFGGQVGVADHMTIGDKVMAGGGTAITKNIEPGQIIAGVNAMPLRDWLRVQVLLPKLAELKKTITEQGKRIKALQAKEQKPNKDG